MEKGTLGKSRKYANGSVHENATGKFQILDRYMGDDDKVILKFQWLSGASEGQIEENKEENINASLYKYRVSRGISEPVKQREDVVTLGQIFELVEETNNISRLYADDRDKLLKQFDSLKDVVQEQQNMIDKLIQTTTQNQKLIDTLVQRNEIVTKLVDKL